MTALQNAFSIGGEDNPWLSWIEKVDPRPIYSSYSSQWGSPNQQDYYESNYDRIYRNYLGSQVNQTRQGQVPEQTFDQYLGGYNWNQEFGRLPPAQRGMSTARFAPPVRWLP